MRFPDQHANSPENETVQEQFPTDFEIKTIHASNYNSSENHGIDIDWDYMEERYSFTITTDEIGSFLAHRTAWKEFLATTHQYCLVMEENVKPVVSLPDIKEVLNNSEQEWEVFFPFHKEDIAPVAKMDREPYLLGFYWGRSPYFLNRKGAQRLLSISRIKQPVDDEILSEAYYNGLKLHAQETEWFDIEGSTDYILEARKKAIRNAVLNSNAWSQGNKELARKILAIISGIAHRLGIDLVLHGGTLLGHIRHGGIMPWDDDIDIGIQDIHLDTFVEAIKEQEGMSWDKVLEESTNTYFYKVWLKEGEKIEGHGYKFPFVDIWLYAHKDNDILFHNKLRFPNALCAPLKTIDFEGASYKIPSNAIECLNHLFKDWDKNIRLYPWSHRLERPSNFPLKIRIEVDNQGRMLTA